MGQRIVLRLAIAVGSIIVAIVVGLILITIATSAPPMLPAAPSADPNTLMQANISRDAGAASTDIAYEKLNGTQQNGNNCGHHGQWALVINPQDVVGHPYAKFPNAQDWVRAAELIVLARTICPSPINLVWFGHDPLHPTYDRWGTLLPFTITTRINGPILQRYALGHARQA